MLGDKTTQEGANGGLFIGQAVEVIRGALTGATGVLVGFSDTQRCHIKLKFSECGVLLVIDRTAVKPCHAAASILLSV